MSLNNEKIKSRLRNPDGSLNGMTYTYTDNGIFKKEVQTVRYLFALLKRTFPYFDNKIQNVPDITYIQNVASRITKGLPLPELKLYQKVNKNMDRLLTLCVTKEDKKLLIALACLYHPELISFNNNIKAYLPLDIVEAEFQNYTNKEEINAITNRLRGGSDMERFHATTFQNMYKNILEFEIDTILFENEKDAIEYNQFPL